MPDVLTAIADIVHHRAFVLPNADPGHTRVNTVGGAFETYCKDRLAGLEPGNDVARMALYESTFSYQGGANNPPDAMYRGGNEGDAFEFKKFSGTASRDIPLNSSPPKDCLRADSYGLAQESIDCEPWTQRDLFFICGGVPAQSTMLNWIWIADAHLMAAKQECYHDLHAKLQRSISEIHGLSFSPTRELGRVNELDPRKATHLRIRAMWTIQAPGKLFEDVAGVVHGDAPVLHAILTKAKWDSMPADSRARVETLRSTPGFTLKDVLVPSPNNPQDQIQSILIRYEKI